MYLNVQQKSSVTIHSVYGPMHSIILVLTETGRPNQKYLYTLFASDIKTLSDITTVVVTHGSSLPCPLKTPTHRHV